MAIGNLHNIIILLFKFIIILWFKFITNLIFVFTFTYCLKEAFNKGSGLKLLININLFFDLFWAFSFLIHSWHSIEKKSVTSTRLTFRQSKNDRGILISYLLLSYWIYFWVIEKNMTISIFLIHGEVKAQVFILLESALHKVSQLTWFTSYFQ